MGRDILSLTLATFVLVGTSPVSVSAQAVPELDRVLVMPFETGPADGQTGWLGEAAAILIGEELAARGAETLTRTERIHALEYLNLSPAATVSRAMMLRLAQAVDATDLIVGTVTPSGTGLKIEGRRVVLESGMMLASVREEGAFQDLFDLCQRVSDRLEGRHPSLGRSPSAVRTRPPLVAFENLVRGLIAQSPERQVSYLEAALTAAPDYDAARLALWDIHTTRGAHDQALAAARGVPQTSVLAGRARFSAGLSHLELRHLAEAGTRFQQLVDTYGTAPSFNNLGVTQLRKSTGPGEARATFYFKRAADLEPDEPDYHFNLGYAYWTEKDLPAATYWLREAVRRNTADGDAHYVLAATLLAAGNTAEGERERELARQLSSKYAEWDARGTGVPRGLERVAGDFETPRVRRVSTAMFRGTARDQLQLASFYLERGRRLYDEGKDSEAVGELRKALYLSPYEAEAHLQLGRVYLRMGRVRQAIDTLRVAVWSRETVEGRIALATALLEARELDAARREAQRALSLDPSSAAAQELLGRLGKSD